MSRTSVYLELGRVSNLPTVWSNLLAGAILAGAAPGLRTLALLVFAGSAFYTGGMFLNDAFDARSDAQTRPERPIPSGRIAAAEVFLVGAGLLALGQLATLAAGSAPRIGFALVAFIVAYDAWHKTNPASPVFMALCRVMLYLLGARAVTSHVGWVVISGCVILFVYLVGLTVWSKRGGDGVGKLIAGISLLDAALILLCGHPLYAAVAALGYPLTLRWQTRVAGT